MSLLASPSAHAVDPSLDWYTIDTPNFRVHFHEGPHMYELAQRTARVCEAAHAVLSPRLRWRPAKKTDVILTDDSDSANGSAFTRYRPWIRLYAEVPDDASVLNDYEDYLWNLVVHEYTHVLHLDTVGGLPAVVDRIVGKQMIPNALAPRWLTEGLATFEESNLSQSGRLRSSLFQMWLRASLLERPFRLDEVTNTPQAWPRGNLAYLYGGSFMDYVARAVGEDALPDYFQVYGARSIPFSLNDSAKTAWDRDFVELYDGWMAETTQRFRAQLEPVREAGVTPLTVLTHAGYNTGAPRFTHDGRQIVYVESGPDRRPALRRMRPDGTKDTLIRELWTSGPFDLSPDDARAAIALSDIYEEYQVYDDLYEVTLKTGDLRRLTWGLRATEPAYAPDGKRIAFIGRGGGGHTWLGVLDPAKQTVEQIAEASPDERLYTPVFTPDGKAIVVSQQHGAGRRIVAYDLHTHEADVWIDADWLSLQPTFGPDGALYVAADRTGIYNLHRYDPRTGDLTQLTNVDTGVFHPSLSPDGARIAVVHYSSSGYDVALLDAAKTFDGALPARPPRGERRYTDDPTALMPVRPYTPLRSLWPQWWLPSAGMDAGGPALGVVTGGSDILERHAYVIEAGLGVRSLEPSVYLAYSNRTFHPGFDAWASTQIAQMAGFPAGDYERQWAAGGQISLPSSSFDHFSAVTVGYEYRYFSPQSSEPYQPEDAEPLIPREGATGTATIGFTYSNARGYADSISSEEGFLVAGTLRHSSPYTLGTFTFTSASGRFQTYLAAPWAKHHAFALRLSGGTALGDLGDRPVFVLGGLTLADPILQRLRGQSAGPGALRGYGSGAFSGNSYAQGTLEYRFPVWQIDRGVDTLPLYARRLHAALFADAGAVGAQAFELGPWKPSAGAELRADLTLGYSLGAQLRLGYARGFAEGGIHNVYFTLGSSF